MSLRNVSKGRIHKERAQPKHRARLGLLEKKKDYRLRARDYHRKQDRLHSLRRAAAFRNPDEFFFNMVSNKTKDGIHVGKRRKPHSAAQIRQFVSEDLSHVNHYLTVGRKRVDKLQADLHFDKDAPKPERIVFVETEEEAIAYEPSSAPVSRVVDVSAKTRRKLGRQRARKHEKLIAHQQQIKELTSVAKRLRLQKGLMGKGRVQKLVTKDEMGREDKTKTVFKWKQERKR